MTKEASSSPDRNTFQKSGYLRRCEERGEDPDRDYLNYFERVVDEAERKFDDSASRVNNLEWDLRTTAWILEKARSDDGYAQNLYASMCNNEFLRHDVVEILKENYWSCSWRYAGGIVADMLQRGDYIDWYCSGIRNVDYDDDENEENYGRGYVAEGVVTDEIRADLDRLGWSVREIEI